MKSARLGVFVLMVLLQGCSMFMRPVSAVSELEPREQNNVFIMRSYNYIGGGGRFWPTVDGKEVSGLFARQYVAFSLPPGRHSLGVTCGLGNDELEVDIKELTSHYYKVSIDLWALMNPMACAEIEEIPRPEALGRLDNSVRIKTGFMSDCGNKSVLYESNPDYVCFTHAFP